MVQRQLLTEGGVTYGSPSLYAILEVSPNASSEGIKQAYRNMVFRYHPDRNQGDPMAQQNMVNINQAYSTLSDPLKRKDYDQRIGNFQLRPVVAPVAQPKPFDGPPLPRPPSQFDRSLMAQRGYVVCNGCDGTASRRVFDPAKGQNIITTCRNCSGMGFVVKRKDW